MNDKLKEMLLHPWLPDALERLADLHDRHGNPFATTTDAQIARALAECIRDQVISNDEADMDETPRLTEN